MTIYQLLKPYKNKHILELNEKNGIYKLP